MPQSLPAPAALGPLSTLVQGLGFKVWGLGFTGHAWQFMLSGRSAGLSLGRSSGPGPDLNKPV